MGDVGATLVLLAILVVVSLVVLIIISIFVAYTNRKQRIGSVISRIVGIVLGGILITFAFAVMMTAYARDYPESFFFEGGGLGLGALIIAIGNSIAERVQTSSEKKTYNLKGTHWVIVNVIPTVVVGYLLTIVGIGIVPVMLLVVAVSQWLLLKQVFPVSPWWILSALFASLGYFTFLAGNLTLGFYIGGVLMAALQYFLLKPHNSKVALFFAVMTLIGWIISEEMFKNLYYDVSLDPHGYLLVLSYHGLVIIWSSVLVGPVAARTLKVKT